MEELDMDIRTTTPSKKQKSLLSLASLKEEVEDLRQELALSHEMLMNLLLAIKGEWNTKSGKE